MNITEHISEHRPTAADLAAFEALIGGMLPDDYKLFLKSENGGRPNPNRFQFSTNIKKTEESKVHYFFALYQGEWEVWRGHLNASKRESYQGIYQLE